MWNTDGRMAVCIFSALGNNTLCYLCVACDSFGIYRWIFIYILNSTSECISMYCYTCTYWVWNIVFYFQFRYESSRAHNIYTFYIYSVCTHTCQQYDMSFLHTQHAPYRCTIIVYVRYHRFFFSGCWCSFLQTPLFTHAQCSLVHVFQNVSCVCLMLFRYHNPFLCFLDKNRRVLQERDWTACHE